MTPDTYRLSGEVDYRFPKGDSRRLPATGTGQLPHFIYKDRNMNVKYLYVHLD